MCGFGLSALAHVSAQSTDAADARARALALEQQGDNARAEQVWQDIAKADAGNAEALAHLGLLEARQERLESAIKFYQQALALNPNLPGLKMNLGLALFKAAQFPDAVRMFSEEIEAHPADKRLTILLGMAHYGMKDYFVAIPYLRRAADIDSKNLTLRMALARACLLSGQYQCASDVNREIQQLNPAAAESKIMAAEALDAQQDHAGAIAQARSALQANSETPNAHFALGYLLWSDGQWEEAATEFKAELQRNPENVDARIYLADTQVRQGDFVTPLPELQKLIDAGSSEPIVHLDLGLVAAKRGLREDAIRELSTAMRGAPDSADIHIRAANGFDVLGKTDEAMLARNLASRMPQGHQLLLDLLETSD